MAVAALHLLVDDDAIEPLLGRFGDELFARAMCSLPRTRSLDKCGLAPPSSASSIRLEIFDLLLAGQQGDLAHLLEVHPYRIVEDVEPGLVVLLLGLRLLDAVHLRLVHDLNIQIPQLDEDLVQFLGGRNRVGKRVIDIVVGQVALLLSQTDEFLDFLGQIKSRLRAVIARRPCGECDLRVLADKRLSIRGPRWANGRGFWGDGLIDIRLGMLFRPGGFSRRFGGRRASPCLQRP